jgi:uncharacterized protein YabE (DUF348 family)
MGGGGGPLPGSSAWPSSFAGPAQYSPSFSAIDAAEESTTEASAYGEPYAPYAEASAEYADPYAPSYPHGDPYGYSAESYSAEAEPYPYEYDYQTPGYPDYYEADGLDEGLSGTSTATLPGPRTAGETARFAPGTQYAPELDPGLDPGPEHGEPRRRPASRRGGTARPAPRRITFGGRVVQGLVLAALVGGVTAYVTLEKTVNISVDGSVRQVHSFASTVGAALASDDVSTGGHDLVTPSPSASLVDNSTITVRYGRPVSVTVDGIDKHVWVHAATVGGALQELGVRVQGARLSVPAGDAIGRTGMAFTVFTMRHITFLVDGKSDQIVTTAATVADAMKQAGITLQNQDAPSVPAASMPTDGETISVLRITGTTKVEQVSIPYPVTKQDDPSSYVGSTTIVTAGVNGVAQVTYAFQTVNGVAQPQKEISRVVTKQPVTEVEKVGTKALPTNVSALNWAALANCESGGNPKAVDPSGTYYGLYQFSVSTWDSLGGSGLPSNASSSEQTTRAELLYQRSGAGQWPVCGHFLFS